MYLPLLAFEYVVLFWGAGSEIKNEYDECVVSSQIKLIKYEMSKIKSLRHFKDKDIMMTLRKCILVG